MGVGGSTPSRLILLGDEKIERARGRERERVTGLETGREKSREREREGQNGERDSRSDRGSDRRRKKRTHAEGWSERGVCEGREGECARELTREITLPILLPIARTYAYAYGLLLLPFTLARRSRLTHLHTPVHPRDPPPHVFWNFSFATTPVINPGAASCGHPPNVASKLETRSRRPRSFNDGLPREGRGDPPRCWQLTAQRVCEASFAAGTPEANSNWQVVTKNLTRNWNNHRKPVPPPDTF